MRMENCDPVKLQRHLARRHLHEERKRIQNIVQGRRTKVRHAKNVQKNMFVVSIVLLVFAIVIIQSYSAINEHEMKMKMAKIHQTRKVSQLNFLRQQAIKSCEAIKSAVKDITSELPVNKIPPDHSMVVFVDHVEDKKINIVFTFCYNVDLKCEKYICFIKRNK